MSVLPISPTPSSLVVEAGIFWRRVADRLRARIGNRKVIKFRVRRGLFRIMLIAWVE